jgi:hypothetical protein
MAGKISKSQAHYRTATDGARCANCTMFKAPGACTLVDGKISPAGVCDYFEPQTWARALAMGIRATAA